MFTDASSGVGGVVQEAFLMGLFSEGLNIGGNFVFQNELGLTIKTA